MDSLQVIEHQRQRVLTTAQLAESFDTEVKRISENFVRNGGRYSYAKHFFLLEGDALRDFKREYANCGIAQNVNILYLWTEKGAWMHAKSLNTDKAWEAYETLVDDYYRAKQQLTRQLSRIELIELARESELARLESETRNAELQYQLQIQEPKVALFDVAMQAHNSQPIGTIAKTLGVGPNKLFQFLREKKVLISQGARYNQPYQEYMDRGYFEVRQFTITHMTQGIENKTQTLVTPKGLAYIHRLLEQAKAVSEPVGM